MSQLSLPDSTFKTLLSKAYELDIDKSWIDWSVEMMEHGFESDNLYMLAGMNQPFNQFEMHDLTNKVLQDFNIDFSDHQAIILNYIRHVILQTMHHPEKYFSVLEEFNNLYLNRDYDFEYSDFSSLYYAKSDLIDMGHQHYWDGADANNIDMVIFVYFRKWLEEHKV